MQTSKSKYVIALFVLTISFLCSSCSETKVTETKVAEKKNEYRLVTPTQEELDEIVPRLEPILSMFHKDYDCTKDNIYEYMFHYDHLDYVYPEYDSEIEAFVAEPFGVSDAGFVFWYEYGIPENDPLGKFPKIRDEIYDENGNVNEDLAWDLLETQDVYYRDLIIGHNKFSGKYIDWLVEGIWNGKADHKSFMKFEDETRLYYYDGFYYTPECVGDRGGGIFYYPKIHNITPLEDGKYEIVYQLYNDGDEYVAANKAVVGLKEISSGFRFWSIFSIDYDIDKA
ncbi:MAG: hypothetical protein E7600_01205 [Ruminococcaceae bacterium]|nr:hypothetical protein [Oscillospiraceae bacterium]